MSVPGASIREMQVPGVSKRRVLRSAPGAFLILARSSTSNRQGTVAARAAFAELSSMYRHCGSEAETNLDTAIAFSLRNTGEYPALSDPVIMVGSIPLLG